MGKLKTHSPIYWIMENWENMLNLIHTFDKMYLSDILLVQCKMISIVDEVPLPVCQAIFSTYDYFGMNIFKQSFIYSIQDTR